MEKPHKAAVCLHSSVVVNQTAKCIGDAGSVSSDHSTNRRTSLFCRHEPTACSARKRLVQLPSFATYCLRWYYQARKQTHPSRFVINFPSTRNGATVSFVVLNLFRQDHERQHRIHSGHCSYLLSYLRSKQRTRHSQMLSSHDLAHNQQSTESFSIEGRIQQDKARRALRSWVPLSPSPSSPIGTNTHSYNSVLLAAGRCKSSYPNRTAKKPEVPQDPPVQRQRHPGSPHQSEHSWTWYVRTSQVLTPLF